MSFWRRKNPAVATDPQAAPAGENLLSNWFVIGRSVLGALHRRLGLPNQDAFGWLPESGNGPAVLLAVADGHGSAKCFRSDEGARLAVETAKEVAGRRLMGDDLPADFAALKARVEVELPIDLGRHWTALVRRRLAQVPFTPAELDALEQKEGAAARKMVEAHPPFAYGATLLMAAVSESCIAYLQLGDGDMAVVSADGVVGRPMPEDARLFANETTSLSSEKDWMSSRVYLQPPGGPAPALILLCTDGYSNCFPNVADPTAEFAADLCKLLRAHGADKVRANLEGWLTEMTEKGSGDDITMAALCRQDAFAPPS